MRNILNIILRNAKAMHPPSILPLSGNLDFPLNIARVFVATFWKPLRSFNAFLFLVNLGSLIELGFFSYV